DMPAGDGGDQVPAAESQDGTEHQLKLDSAFDECRRLMARALEQDERWVFEIDPSNTCSIEVDASATPPAIVAKADLRDSISGAKKKALVALGWKVSDGTTVKASVAAAALYLTGGLAAAALLRRGVRDVLMAIEGTRSGVVARDRGVVTGPAADFAGAPQRVAPDGKTSTVKRRPAGPEEWGSIVAPIWLFGQIIRDSGDPAKTDRTAVTSCSDGRRHLRARLPQRMLQRECLDLHAGI